MWRVLAALVAALVAWIGLAQPGEAVAAPVPQVVGFSYDTHHRATPMIRDTSERGPPAYDHDTAPSSVGLRPFGTSAPPATGTNRPIIAYDYPALLVQVDGVATTTQVATPDSSALLSPFRRSRVAANTRPAFIASADGVVVPTSRSRMVNGFDNAGFPSTPTTSPGIQYTLPDGTLVRIMEPSGQAPLRASFTNANGGAISPFTGKPVQPPPGLTKLERRHYVWDRTHVELGQ